MINPQSDTPSDALITDSHCHLDFPDFDGEHAQVVARAREAGVHRMVTICTRLDTEPKVRALAETFENVYYAAGTHPNSVHQVPLVTVEALMALQGHPKYVAVGESGLDYHYTPEHAKAQKTSLLVHIEAAQRGGLPLVIHSRDADEDMADILSTEYKNAPFSCVMHCFCSGAGLARAALDLGFYLSMSGIAAFKNSHELRAIFAAAPVDRILVETDSPYLAPPPHRGTRNEPAYTAHTARVGAEVFGLSYSEFASQSEENFLRLFSKVAQAEAHG